MSLLSFSVPGERGTSVQLQVPSGIPQPSSATTNGASVIQLALGLLFLTAVLLALFFSIFAGIQWITASGDKQKIASARLRLTYAVVGLIVVFASFTILSIVGKLFNISFFASPGS